MPLHSHTSSSAKIRRCCVDSLNSPHKADIPRCLLFVRFSNRPSGVKRFQAFRLSTNSSVDVAHGLALLFGLGTKALPSWDSKTRWNNLSGDLAVDVTAGSSGQTNSPHPSSREGHHSTAGWSSILLLSAVKPLRLPCSTGTRCRQPTCGA